MKKVVYYARVSTEEEKQINALKNQIEELEEFIENQSDWILVDKYIDEGISGTFLKKRDDFKKLIQDLHTDKFDIVVVKDETRVGRNSYEAGYFLSPLIINNKQLFYYLDNKFFNPEEELLNSVKYGMAAQFSRDLSKKINQSQKKRMEKGRVVTNGRMWGYDQKDGQLFINEKEAEVVRIIFELYAEGDGARIIRNKLDEMGIFNQNGNSFSLSTIKRMIKNEKYKGVLIMGKRHKDFNTKKFNDVPESQWITHYDKIPAIVSEELWERVNKELEKKRKDYGLNEKGKIAGYFNGNYIYSGKIKCGKCGRPYYHSIYTTGKNKDIKLKMWECKGYREFGKSTEKDKITGKIKGCDNTKILDNELEGIVKHVVFDFWKNKDENIKKVIEVLERILSDDQYQTTIEKLKIENQKVNKKKEKLIELYSEELINRNEFKDRNDEYNRRIEKLQADIQDLEQKNKSFVDKKERLHQIQAFFQTKLENENDLSDDVIDSFLEETIIYPDNKIEITLNGDFKFIATKDNNKYIYQNVPSPRPL